MFLQRMYELLGGGGGGGAASKLSLLWWWPTFLEACVCAILICLAHVFDLFCNIIIPISKCMHLHSE